MLQTSFLALLGGDRYATAANGTKSQVMNGEDVSTIHIMRVFSYVNDSTQYAYDFDSDYLRHAGTKRLDTSSGALEQIKGGTTTIGEYPADARSYWQLVGVIDGIPPFTYSKDPVKYKFSSSVKYTSSEQTTRTTNLEYSSSFGINVGVGFGYGGGSKGKASGSAGGVFSNQHKWQNSFAQSYETAVYLDEVLSAATEGNSIGAKGCWCSAGR